mmetsp:Transcript_113499/g.327776  ORF Transcript_113499/g.327776 Transcript_113499/m.327776 type:complete len:489 (+) Transcript_113499:373-1839(+)
MCNGEFFLSGSLGSPASSGRSTSWSHASPAISTTQARASLIPGRSCGGTCVSVFLIDAPLVMADWIEVFVPSFQGFRFALLLRLLRVIKLRGIFQLLHDRLRSDLVIIIANIVLNLTLILSLTHLTACAWWGIGDSGAKGWMLKHKEDLGLDSVSIAYAYLTSLHWSLSQLTGGMDEVKPQNLEERVFAVVIFVIFFLVAAVFVSSMTSSLTQLNMLADGSSREIATLRWYLKENSITSALSARILRTVNRALKAQRADIPEDSVDLLKHLSEPLRMELHFEQYKPIFDNHPFFKRYSRECPGAMRKVCHLAVSYETVAAGDIVFAEGDIMPTPAFFIVVHGGMSYEHGLSHKTTPVAAGDWAAEGPLWMEWAHQGTLTASDETKLCMLGARQFQEIVGKYSHRGYNPRVYAKHWIQGVKDYDISDLRMGFEDAAAEQDDPNANYDATSSGRLHSFRFSAQSNFNRTSSSSRRSSSNASQRRSETDLT